jgi:S1-C subfamily serine protease
MPDRQKKATFFIIALLVGLQLGLLNISLVKPGYQLDLPEFPGGESGDSQGSNTIISNGTAINLSVNDSRSQLYHSIFSAVENAVVSVATFDTSGGTVQQASSGSGFVYNTDGYLITNNHVISQGDRYEVTLLNGNVYEAELVGSDPYTDLAVLRIDPEATVDAIPLGEEEDIQVGAGVLAIGNPFGLSGSMTHGIISQTDRLLPATGGFSIPNVIQTDAAVNPGNSGGPLLNLEGEVIGVNTAIDTRTSTFSGVGFAVSASTVRRVVPELIQTGDFSHPWIGVSGTDVTPAIAEEMGLENPRGFLVLEVQDDSPAAVAGLQAGNQSTNVRGREIELGGDVIVGIDDKKVRKIQDILNYLAQEASVGDTIPLTVIRDGERQEVELTLQERPAAN